MKKIILFAGLCLFGHLLTAQTIYSRVRIDLKNHSIRELAALGIETDHGDYVPGRSLSAELSDREIQLVKTAGFETEILIPDLKKWYRDGGRQGDTAGDRGGGCDGPAPVSTQWETPKNYQPGSMGGYPTYAEMLATLDDMQAKYPELITVRAVVSDSLLTHEGRPLWYVKISDHAATEEAEPKVLYTALHHAREPNSLSQLLFYMWYLLEHYSDRPEVQYIVDNAELYFVPCVNPDGYLFNEATDPQGGGLWRKNRRDNGGGTYGVDLNRNYGYEWGFDDGGSSPNPNSEVYRGPEGFSEPETRMMRDFCLAHPFQFVLNYHTKGNLLIYPWAYSDELADQAFAEFAPLLIRENQFKYGTSIETVGYRVNGSSDDWMYGAADALSFTPEVGPGAWGFWPQPDQIDGLNKTTIWQNLVTAWCLLRYGRVTDRGTADLDLSKPRIDFELKRYGFENGPLTVSLKALTSNIVAVSAPLTFTLDQFETVDSFFTVALALDVKVGDKARFVLTLDNGTIAFRDTLEKTFSGPGIQLFSETASAPIDPAWTILGTWERTAEQYVSAPYSITDSPGGNYESDAFNQIELTTPVLIPADAQSAQLRFFARWAIETGFDFVQVYAGNNASGMKPLCGRYTTPGTDFQGLDQPVYDGFQSGWVEECMDLSEYIGQNITIQFVLIADGFQEYDGFYFDDLNIGYSTTDFVGTIPIPAEGFVLLQNNPNPAAGHTFISWDGAQPDAESAELLVYDVLGNIVRRLPADLSRQQGLGLDTRSLPPGAYFSCLPTENGRTWSRRTVVSR